MKLNIDVLGSVEEDRVFGEGDARLVVTLTTIGSRNGSQRPLRKSNIQTDSFAAWQRAYTRLLSTILQHMIAFRFPADNANADSDNLCSN